MIDSEHLSADAWRRVVYDLKDAVMIFDPLEETILEANASVEAVYGWRREELIGRSLREFSVDVDRGAEAVHQTLSAPRSTNHFRTRQIRRDATEIVIDVSASVIHYDGRAVILTINRDVTAQVVLLHRVKSAAKEWQMTLDAIADPVIVVDAGHAIVRLNEAARQLADDRTFVEVIGLTIAGVSAAEPWSAFERLAAAVDAGSSRGEQCVDPVSHVIWDVSASAGLLWTGRPCTILIARDITNFIRLEEAARHNEVVAELGRLVGAVAHEVRNPLFSISANAEMLELKLTGRDPVVDRCLENLRREVHRMTALMRDLLEYGKPPALDVRLEPADSPVDDAVQMVAGIAAERGVTIDVAADGEALVLIDRARMAQAFQNIIENAVLLSGSGTVVSISSRIAGDAERPSWQWMIDDSAAGFTPEALRSAFDPFFTTRAGGTGLGLAIVRRIVEMHGGTTAVANRAKGGGRVLVEIPIYRSGR